MTLLSVNVDHVATVREARKINQPDPVEAAVLAELAGADGITIHLRGDRRHIQERDFSILRKVVKPKLNLELAVEEEVIAIALDIGPDMATFVPERSSEVTTEGGLDATLNREILRGAIDRFHEREIPVSLFIDPDVNQVKAAHGVGADFVEMNTSRYSEALTDSERADALADIENCCKLASKLRLRVNAGHGLNYKNVGPIAAIAEIEELNIGHSIVGRAVLIGMERAVRDMIEAMRIG